MFVLLCTPAGLKHGFVYTGFHTASEGFNSAQRVTDGSVPIGPVPIGPLTYIDWSSTVWSNY